MELLVLQTLDFVRAARHIQLAHSGPSVEETVRAGGGRKIFLNHKVFRRGSVSAFTDFKLFLFKILIRHKPFLSMLEIKYMKFWSRQTALVASKLASPSDRHSAPIRLFVICGLLLVAAVAISTGFILSNLRSRALADSVRELENIALVLAEHTDRAFQALDLVKRA